MSKFQASAFCLTQATGLHRRRVGGQQPQRGAGSLPRAVASPRRPRRQAGGAEGGPRHAAAPGPARPTRHARGEKGEVS